MSTVWKYSFELTDEPVVSMPQGARVLHADCHRPSHPLGVPGLVEVWALVDPDAPTEPRRFRLCGTGHHLPDYPGEHVATFRDGPFVWHLFEATP